MHETPHNLSAREVKRYGRQLIVPEIGVRGQMALKKCRILIVGAGGLGCPCAIYLAAAGIGTIGIIDGDSIEENNLHRQVLHTEARLNTPKAESVKMALQALNSSVICEVYKEKLTSENGLSLVSKYDIVCDCSDNAPTRYLINDACMLAKKPLVSGSALRWDGQLTVYSAGQGPCYRCLYPKPQPAHTVTSCAQGGVIGTVPGTIGTLQANEAIKIAVGMKSSFVGRMLVYDGQNGEFRCVKLRSANQECAVCGTSPSVQSLINYETFCGAPACDSVRSISRLVPEDRVSVQQLHHLLSCDNVLLIDCRPSHQFEIGHLTRSINLPLDMLEKAAVETLETLLKGQSKNVFVICHRGNQSQMAVIALRTKLAHLSDWQFRDVIGGVEAWSKEIDHTFPVY